MATRKSGFLAHDWQLIENRMNELAGDTTHNVVAQYRQATAELVRHLRKSGVADSLFGQTSLDSLRLSTTNPVAMGGGTLLIERAETEGMIRLVFEEYSWPNPALGKKNWFHEYRSDEIKPALARFFLRAGWFVKNHPAVIALVGAMDASVE